MLNREPIDVILSYLPPHIRTLMERTRNAYAPTVQEIAVRADRPLCIYCADARCYVTASGVLVSAESADLVGATAAQVQEMLMNLCEYSVYSHQDELIRGYVTAAGGVRVGICGTAVLRDDRVTAIRKVTTLSFRVPREVRGCADELLRLIRPLGGVLVCGAPCSGKTTLIRDLARRLSLSYRVSVIDERGELAAAVSPGGGCDLGFCDIYSMMPKREGVICAIRSMAPDIIVCDELGDESDAAGVSYALRCGVAFIATIHASSLDDLRRRPVTRELLRTGAFRYLVFLDGRRSRGRIRSVCEWGDRDA